MFTHSVVQRVLQHLKTGIRKLNQISSGPISRPDFWVNLAIITLTITAAVTALLLVYTYTGVPLMTGGTDDARLLPAGFCVIDVVCRAER